MRLLVLALCSVVIVTTIAVVRAGRTLVHVQRQDAINAELPLVEAELFDKFRTCLDAGHARISPERLFDRLRNLEKISASELTAVG